MPYIGCEREQAIDSVKDVNYLSIPAGATWVEIQADTQNVRYTMDGSTEPTAALGMLFLTTDAPKVFLIGDLKNIKFIRAGGSHGWLNFHYGRENDF